jgi:hypothetical protein
MQVIPNNCKMVEDCQHGICLPVIHLHKFQAEFVDSGIGTSRVQNYCRSIAMYNEIQKVFAGQAQYYIKLSYNLLWHMGVKWAISK